MKCPHCTHHLSSVRMDGITGKSPGHIDQQLVAYSCTHSGCGKVISIQLGKLDDVQDPLKAAVLPLRL